MLKIVGFEGLGFFNFEACQAIPNPAKVEMEKEVVESNSSVNDSTSTQSTSSSTDSRCIEFPNKEINRGVAEA